VGTGARVSGDAADFAASAERADLLERADTPAEVDAISRTLRRVAVGYFVLFLIVVVAVPVLTIVLEWWSIGRVLGGMSPSFVMAAGGLYVFFFIVAVLAATLSSAVEARMLGGPTSDGDADGST
jgi:hypothetical protein